jgi:signal transduction histidine kinase
MRLHLPAVRLPRRTVRLRLTVLYCSVFLILGVVVLAITVILSGIGLSPSLSSPFLHAHGSALKPAGGTQGSKATAAFQAQLQKQLLAQVHQVNRELVIQTAQYRAAETHDLLVDAAIALGIMVVLAVGLGWLVTGLFLRPLRAMTTAARQISEDDLHQRLAVPGPQDELKELADTIDSLLARLETAFEAQRNFVASASHELRTPLTLSRTLLQTALTDPHPTLDSFRATCEGVLEADERQEQLIDALLTLARSQRGLDRREAVDLAGIITDTLTERESEAAMRGLAVTASVTAAPVAGDPRLLRQLAGNLVDNALRHNIRGGRVDVTAGADGGAAHLTISNTGPVISPGQVSTLLQPFQRLSGRTADEEGLGMGLPIIAAIAKAHGAALTINPRQHGGLDVEVSFPPVGSTARRDKALAPA